MYAFLIEVTTTCVFKLVFFLVARGDDLTKDRNNRKEGLFIFMQTNPIENRYWNKGFFSFSTISLLQWAGLTALTLRFASKGNFLIVLFSFMLHYWYERPILVIEHFLLIYVDKNWTMMTGSKEKETESDFDDVVH